MKYSMNLNDKFTKETNNKGTIFIVTHISILLLYVSCKMIQYNPLHTNDRGLMSQYTLNEIS